MGWNRSSGAAARPTPKKPSALRGAVAGVVCAGLAAAVALFVLSGKDEKPKAKAEKEAGLIKEVKPAAAPKVEPEKARRPKQRPYWENPTTNGLSATQILKWKHAHVPPATKTNRVTRVEKAKWEIFDTAVENELAGYITIEPGEGMIGTPRYGERFKNSFLQSCETPIVVTEDDDEYAAGLKRDMNQLKIELRQRMADGEDLGKIMSDTRAEIQRLAQIKAEIEHDMRALIKEGAQSDEDVDGYVEAANKMLEAKGIAPVKMTPVMRRALIRSIRHGN